MEKTKPYPFLRSDFIRKLEELVEKLLLCSEVPDKLACLQSQEDVAAFLRSPSFDICSFSQEEQILLLSLVVLGQEEHLEIDKASDADLRNLIEELAQVEAFYGFIGGVIGYHLCCLRLYDRKHERRDRGELRRPEPVDIAGGQRNLRPFRLAGIAYLDQLAEIYPVGGAADRLCKKTQQIAATRLFLGKSLLKRLIEDVEAREYLYAKLYGRAIRVPIVMMASDEKKGKSQIEEHLEEQKWFGRSPEDFFLLNQPLVPAMSKEGQWIAQAPGRPVYKPGGHGVIWKVAQDAGAFQWLKERGKSKALVRQINNPIAGVDDGICLFTGYGFVKKKHFGFASCPRAENVSEGVNVVIASDAGYTLTNIEYCDFEEYGIDGDADLLANTNLLFVDLETAEELLLDNPIPGMLINAKTTQVVGYGGTVIEREMIRLESTMQNLADGLIEERPQTRTFITCNARLKTISPIKQEYETGKRLTQTPEQCFIDFQLNAQELLKLCGFSIEEGAFFEHHPALGPFYDIIAQKLRGGRMLPKSSFNLQIAEVDIEQLTVFGNLAIYGKDLTCGPSESRCFLRNVAVHGQCEITIERGGEFFAENVDLKGNLQIIVEKNTKVSAIQVGDEIKWTRAQIERPSWQWKYSITSEEEVALEKQKSG